MSGPSNFETGVSLLTGATFGLAAVRGPLALLDEVISEVTGAPLDVTGFGKRTANEAGFVREFLTETEWKYFRVFSGDKRVGGYLTKMRPKSSAFAQEAFSLPRANRADLIQEVLVPANTRLRRSRAGSINANDVFPNRRGGAEQFELIDRIPTRNFGPGVPFK